MEKKSTSDRPSKKTYRRPELAYYGDITQITRGGTGTTGDGGATHTKVACWIAEALYGVDAPRTHLVRAWLRECYAQRKSWALVVVPIYCRFGQTVAREVGSHTIAERLFRPLFDRAVACAHRDYASRIADRVA